RGPAGDPARDDGAAGGPGARADDPAPLVTSADGRSDGPVNGPIGVLVMAYGTAGGPDDVERYYTDIRGGRPPTPEHLRELQERYAAIGNRFPLLDITTQQAKGLEEAIGDGFASYLGMKHSPPFIP